MTTSLPDRAQFVVDFVSSAQKQSSTHEQVVALAESTANMLEHMEQSKISLDKLAAVGTTKTAVGISQFGANLPWESILGSIKDVGVAGIKGTGRLVSDVARGAASATPTALALGLAVPAVAGYGVGHMVGGFSQDPDRLIEAARHQEMIGKLKAYQAQLERMNRQHQRKDESSETV